MLSGFPPAPGNRRRAGKNPVTISVLKRKHTDDRQHRTRNDRHPAGRGLLAPRRAQFLIPYRHILIHQYGGVILLWITVLFVNVFAGVYAIQRKFFLKDTGRKLSHVDNQVTCWPFRVALPNRDPGAGVNVPRFLTPGVRRSRSRSS